MSTKALDNLLKEAESLSLDEQLHLAARLIEKISRVIPNNTSKKPQRKWKEICGIATYPLTGQDAQEWVSQTRKQSDEQRQSLLKD